MRCACAGMYTVLAILRHVHGIVPYRVRPLSVVRHSRYGTLTIALTIVCGFVPGLYAVRHVSATIARHAAWTVVLSDSALSRAASSRHESCNPYTRVGNAARGGSPLSLLSLSRALTRLFRQRTPGVPSLLACTLALVSVPPRLVRAPCSTACQDATLHCSISSPEISSPGFSPFNSRSFPGEAPS